MSKKSKATDESQIDSNWFGELITNFIPSDTNIEGRTVEQLISSASRKAFVISCTAAIPPGFFGWATIIPELIMITKIQINLIYSIAKFYNQSDKVMISLLAIIFSNALGLELGKGVLKKAGVGIIISKTSAKLLEPILKNISVKTLSKLIARLPSRWIPLIAAPFFGAWSASNTKVIGYEANRLFSKNIKFEEDLEFQQF